jgi:hypothetical protein
MPEKSRERSLLPIDIGFDLRSTGISVRIYEGFSYKYLDQNSKKAFAYPDSDAGSTGNLMVVAEDLAHAGYCVTPFKTPVGGDVIVVPDATSEGDIVWNVKPEYGDGWLQGDTLQEALKKSKWKIDDLEPLSSDEY